MCSCYCSRRCLSRGATTRTISYIQKTADPSLPDVAEQPDLSASLIGLRVRVTRNPIVAVRRFPTSTNETLLERFSYLPTIWRSVWLKKNSSSPKEGASGRTSSISPSRRDEERARRLKVVNTLHICLKFKSAPVPLASVLNERSEGRACDYWLLCREARGTYSELGKDRSEM